jgi:hypothetical protein
MTSRVLPRNFRASLDIGATARTYDVRVSAVRRSPRESLTRRTPLADMQSMGSRSFIAVLACAATLVAPASVAAYSSGTPGQVAWVRRSASNFVAAELARNGSGVCSIINAPLRGRACAQRWNAKLAKLLREPGGRAGLQAERRAIRSAAVVVRGNTATIDLPAPLTGSGANRFLWTESCWMLEG